MKCKTSHAFRILAIAVVDDVSSEQLNLGNGESSGICRDDKVLMFMQQNLSHFKEERSTFQMELEHNAQKPETIHSSYPKR
jgi:hypothetical protein